MKKQKQVEFSLLLAELKVLTVEELLTVYIESKTGNYEDVEIFLKEDYDLIDDLWRILTKHYADKNMGTPFGNPYA